MVAPLFSNTLFSGTVHHDSTITNDYDNAENKPQINSVTLHGNKTASDLHLAPASLVQTVTDNYNEITEDLEAVHDLIDDTTDNSIVNISRVGDDLSIRVTYGDEEGTTADVDLSHLHSQYLTNHQDLSEYAKTQEVAVYLEDKAQKNLSNVTAGYDWVVVSNKTSGYRNWRNGWTECRGIVTTTTSNDGVEVTLPIAYTDTNYILQVSVNEIGNWFVSSTRVGVQKIKIRVNDYYGTPVAVKVSWETKGYIYVI